MYSSTLKYWYNKNISKRAERDHDLKLYKQHIKTTEIWNADVFYNWDRSLDRIFDLSTRKC